MARGLKLGGQALALAAVGGLLALLVWRIAHENRDTAAARIAHGRTGPAPGFSAPRLEGAGKLSLAAFRGKAVVINFWASWCGPCKLEAPALQASWQRYRGQGLVVVGVDWNDVSADARSFARKHGLTYPQVRDRTGAIGDSYGLRGVPETFFVDRRGRLVGEHVEGPVHKGVNKERFERGISLALAS